MVEAGAVRYHIDVPRALRRDRQRHLNRLRVAVADAQEARILEAENDGLIVECLVAAGPSRVRQALISRGQVRILRKHDPIFPKSHRGWRRALIGDDKGYRHARAREDTVGRRRDGGNDQIG